MSAGGAVVAIAAAAHARRVQEVTDAFRLAGATAPERAQSLAALGVTHAAAAEELAGAGVLVAGPGRDTWYLSEAAVVARRDARVPRKLLLVLVIVLLATTAILVGVLVANRAPST